MELNWKEDNNLVRKFAKILLGDTLPNGEPVSSFILLDDTSRAELQRWANMSDAEFAAAQRSGDCMARIAHFTRAIIYGYRIKCCLT